MKQNLLRVLGVVVLLASFLVAAMPAGAGPPIDYSPVDVGPEVRQWEATPERLAPVPKGFFEAGEAAAEALMLENSCISDAKIWILADFFTGYLYLDWFYLMGEGEESQIWVQTDLSWPPEDPRETPVITCEQAAYMVDQFDNNIQPTMEAFFGPPNYHDGTNAILDDILGAPSDYYYDADGRQVVLVSNIRDDNYYDPDYPLYVAGFYSGSLEGYFDRNTMSIDAYDWENRTGPDSARPYLYEGTFVHEFEHLLHDDYDPNEENWINEGLADWAEWLCGYGLPAGHIGDLIDMPENSLVAWGDQGDLEILADYGIAYMYQEYMYEQFGPDFILNEFQDGALQGISSVNWVLNDLGESVTFADTFHDFSVAMYTEGAFTLEGLTDFQVDVGPPRKRNAEAYATPGAPPWGTDYYLLWGDEQIANFRFNGYEFNPTAWTSDGDVLFGGTGDLIDNFLIVEADLTSVTGAELTFDTLFEIEWSWDYGFVQVSTDGGTTWASLANADTCSDLDPGAHPKVVANVPGFTGVSGYGCNDPYAADPYPEAQWLTTTFDLSAYDGQEILIAFRYVTDWAFNEPGWYVDNVNIAGVFTSDGSSTDGFLGLNEALGIANDFTVTFVGERIRKGQPEYEVQTLMSGGYVSDWASIRSMFDRYRWLVMLVTYDAPEGVTDYAEYTFEIDHRGGKHLK